MERPRSDGDFDLDYESQLLADGYAGFSSSEAALKETGSESSNSTPKRRLGDIRPSVSEKANAVLNTEKEVRPEMTDINLEMSKRKAVNVGGEASGRTVRPWDIVEINFDIERNGRKQSISILFHADIVTDTGMFWGAYTSRILLGKEYVNLISPFCELPLPIYDRKSGKRNLSSYFWEWIKESSVTEQDIPSIVVYKDIPKSSFRR